MPISTSRIFCFGHGYLARHVTEQLQKNHWIATGTHRDPRDGGVVFDAGHRMNADAEDLLCQSQAVLISVPPDATGDPVYRLYADFFRTMPHLKWIGYCSSTAVYGDCNGAWVDEASPLAPLNERGRMRALAEQQWLGTDLPVQVFRLAGIYGKGRSALDQAAQNAPLVTKPDHVLNRIHVADAARAIGASIQVPLPNAIYNLSDDCPAPRDEVTAYAYHLLNKESPMPVAWDKADLSPMARSFFAECKRVQADKIKQALGMTWLYPDYKTGLKACL